MPVKFLLLACALFIVHGVSIASKLSVPAVVAEKNKSVDSASVKSSAHAKVRSKPAVAPASIHIPIEKPTVSVPEASSPVTQNKK